MKPPAPLKRPPGRPSAGREAMVKLRTTLDEKEAWSRRAKAAGRNLSEWLRHLANAP